MSMTEGMPVKNRWGNSIGYVVKENRNDGITFLTIEITDDTTQKILQDPDVVDYLFFGISDNRSPGFVSSIKKGNLNDCE